MDLANDMSCPQVNDMANGIWKMTFYTPEPTVMMLDEVHQAGYGAMSTPNRLVVRSPYNTAQTYPEDVCVDLARPNIFLNKFCICLNHLATLSGGWSPDGGCQSGHLLRHTTGSENCGFDGCLSYW